MLRLGANEQGLDKVQEDLFRLRIVSVPRHCDPDTVHRKRIRGHAVERAKFGILPIITLPALCQIREVLGQSTSSYIPSYHRSLCS